jgi:hypothetical protein
LLVLEGLEALPQVEAIALSYRPQFYLLWAVLVREQILELFLQLAGIAMAVAPLVMVLEVAELVDMLELVGSAMVLVAPVKANRPKQVLVAVAVAVVL